MDMSVSNPAKCEVRFVVWLPNMKVEAQAEIHHQIVSVYGNVFKLHNVAKWCREFNAERTDVRDELLGNIW
jgi:hypothetical protein